MNRYEVLILTIPEITKDEELSIERGIEKALNDKKGSLISFERWGKYQLAFPVKSHEYGVYFLARFEFAGTGNAVLEEVKSLFQIKFNDYVMRHVVTALKPGQSLEYRKPQSLEDAPKKHVGLFDKKDSRGGYGHSAKDLDDEENGDINTVDDSEETTEEFSSSKSFAAANENSQTCDVEVQNQDQEA